MSQNKKLANIKKSTDISVMSESGNSVPVASKAPKNTTADRCIFVRFG